MKRTINLIALFVASLFITAGVWAQTGEEQTIPFNFTVNGSYVPAGTYTITATCRRTTTSLRSAMADNQRSYPEHGS